jgi:exopolyphosphatase/guanosine-5'-triphosphate,3'-diphosphate pyrophosphatase
MDVPTRFATADIGSNTVHLLVAETTERGLQRLINDSEWLSLGEKVSRHKRIPPEDVQKLIATLTRFKRLAEDINAEFPYVFATEAMRVADNHEEVIVRIKAETGLRVEIIAPTREAELSFIGASLDCPTDGRTGLVEVGGGSAQVAVFHSGVMEFEKSLPIGTGKLSAQFALSQPCPDDLMDDLRAHVRELFKGLNVEPVQRILASGGVARGLWRALHPDGNRHLRRFEVDYLVEATKSLTAETISRRFDVKAKRARTLLPGGLIFQEAMSLFELPSMMISEFGVREGAIVELARGAIVR